MRSNFQQRLSFAGWALCSGIIWFGVRGFSAETNWVAGDGYRSRALTVPAGQTGFALVSPEASGIVFSNHLSDLQAAQNQIRLNGGGVAAGDVDGDGFCDLYFCGLARPNVLYKNLGNWKFQDVTAQAGVACEGQSSQGAIFADIDGDGHLDLLVTSIGGGTRCFINDGKGGFAENATNGLIRKFAGTSMALADVDGDGDLDLYVANNRTTTIRSTGAQVLNVGGKRMIRPEDRDHLELTPDGRLLEHGEVDILYLNEGRGNFRAQSWVDGTFQDEEGKNLTAPPRDWGLSVMFADLNGDSAPDIYVCNDFHSVDRIWINDGRGHFRALSNLALRNTSSFSMGIDVGDINRDGKPDLFVVDMLDPNHGRRIMQTLPMDPTSPYQGIHFRPQNDRNTLHLNRGDGTFAEIAQFSGVEASGWSWVPMFLDVDLDGYEDLLITTGHLFDTQDLDAEGVARPKNRPALLSFPRLLTPKVALRNRHDLTFEDASARWGFNQTGVSHGMAAVDLDNDGDLDLVMNNLNAPAGLYRNESGAPRLAVRLRGQGANPEGIGSIIRVSGGPVAQSQEMRCGGRYLSGEPAMRVFAPGASASQLTVEVVWRLGGKTLITNAKPNTLYEITEPAGSKLPATRTPRAALPETPRLFEDVSFQINHVHHDEPYNDFLRQPLLPNRLSQLGPGVAWWDLDGDGVDELIVGSGRGGRLGVFHRTSTNFVPAATGPSAARDETSIVGYKNGVLVGTANYEDGRAEGATVEFFQESNHVSQALVPANDSSTGPLAMADFDRDGILDLFVGGRVVPGKYPSAPRSRLFRGRSSGFFLKKEFPDLGMVTGAVASDLNGDGWPDLILACEWGPLRMLENRRGELVDVTRERGLDRYTGWWNAVAVGDFDGDGHQDLVAANWGRNTRYQAHRSQPLKLYYGDLAGNGSMPLIEAFYDTRLKKIVPERGLEILSVMMPELRARFPSHRAFGEAGIDEILAASKSRASLLEATWLESTVFLNRSNRFEPHVLPAAAQFAPAFGISVADFDGDGIEDIFLSQNFFGQQPETSRYDAGEGLLMKGDGKGGFTPVPGAASGIQIHGEQRGCAVSDYDGDGRVDLVVAQNNAETRLFHNRLAKSGLRIRLIGPAGNPQAIGAVIRLENDKQKGPAHEIHSGTGYWSQDGVVQVMAMAQTPQRVMVRWPAGHPKVFHLPPGAKDIEIDVVQGLKQIR